MISLQTILHRGLVAINKESLAKDDSSSYRAGSSGIFTEAGEIMGTCHRITHLRKEGIQVPIEPERTIMFECGRNNELAVLRFLEAGGQPARKGEDGELSMEIAPGITVTGTPDVFLLDVSGKPFHILELKNVSSIYTIRSVSGKAEPKSPHLIQAALYSMLSGLPASIVYTSAMDWHIPFAPKFIAEDMKGKPGVKYDNDRPMCIQPQFVIYDTTWKDDTFAYRLEWDRAWNPTRITKQGLVDYYSAVDAMAKQEQLGPRPSKKTVTGGKSYNPCDPSYCKLANVCSSKEAQGYRAWKDAAILEVKKLTDEYGY